MGGAGLTEWVICGQLREMGDSNGTSKNNDTSKDEYGAEANPTVSR